MTVLRTSMCALSALVLCASLAELAHGQQDVAISQTGNDNKTTVTQNGQGTAVSANIIGSRNGRIDGTITQDGDGAYAEIHIEGDENNFSVAQDTASGFLGVVYGSGNALSVDQVNAYSEAYQNYGAALQAGYGNTATLEQQVEAYGESGGLNQAYINQYGNDNTALLEQTGTDNLATITQDGNGNTGTLIQNGVGLSAALNQIGDNLPGYTITQDCVATAACNQDITVNQTNAASGFLVPSAGS